MSPHAPALPPLAKPATVGSDPTHLQQHIGHCVRARSPMHFMRGAAEVVDAFVSPRIVTTLLVLVVLLAGLAWAAS